MKLNVKGILGNIVLKKGNSNIKFVVFAQGRTGSSVLVDLLNSHPQIKCMGEILNPNFRIGNNSYGYMVWFPRWFINGLSKLNNAGSFGFKVKIYQIDKQPFIGSTREFMDYLEANNWKLIYLYRENVFEHALSTIVAEMTSTYHLKNEMKVDKFKLDLDRLVYLMRERETFRNREVEELEGRSYFTIEYNNDLNENLERTLSDLQLYLGCKHHKLNTNLKKIVPKDYNKLIENYEEVKSFLKLNGYGQYISGESN